MRLLNIFVIGALILAASFVYKIKFDSTLQAERVGQARRPSCAASATPSRACAPNGRKLDTPGRIQGLADRHLALQPIAADAIRQPRPAARAPAGRSRRPPTIRSAPCSRAARRDRQRAGARGDPMSARAQIAGDPLAARAALAALRPRRRPQRQGQGAARPRHRRLRRHLRRHRAAAGDVRASKRRPRRAPQRRPGRGRHRAARHPRPQRARSSPPT